MGPEVAWTGMARDYDIPHLRLRQIAALVDTLRPRRLLDLGCGRGQLRELCAGPVYVGCDILDPADDLPFPYYRCDLNRERLPEQLTGFDAITCSGLLEYLDDLPAVLRQARERLRAGGALIASFFNMSHVSRLIQRAVGRKPYVHSGWRNFHSPSDFAALLRSVDLDIRSVYATRHSLLPAGSAAATLRTPTRLLPARPWSSLLAHQLIFVATRE